MKVAIGFFIEHRPFQIDSLSLELGRFVAVMTTLMTPARCNFVTPVADPDPDPELAAGTRCGQRDKASCTAA